METSQTPFRLPRAAHPDLSPTSLFQPEQNPESGPADATAVGTAPPEEPAAEVVATGPFKVYSQDAMDWIVGIDLRVEETGLVLTAATGQHRFAADRFTVEMSPDGRIVWILGNPASPAGRIDTTDRAEADGADLPAVTVLMPATADDLRTRMPGVEFADLDEAAHIVHRLTTATAAGRHTRHRFGLQRPGDLGLVVDPLDGEPVLALLRLTDLGMEFRGGGEWEKDSPAQRIAPFTALVPVTRGAVDRFDHLERSPSMSLSLFRRFVIPSSLGETVSPQSPVQQPPARRPAFHLPAEPQRPHSR